MMLLTKAVSSLGWAFSCFTWYSETSTIFHQVLKFCLTVPDEVGAELGAVQIVLLTLVVEPHLLGIHAILPWQGMTFSSRE